MAEMHAMLTAHCVWDAHEMSLDPVTVLREATHQVPAVKYALGVAGVAAAGAIVVSFIGYSRFGVILIAGIFIAMILLYLFSTMITSRIPETTAPGIILTHAVVYFFCIFLIFTVTAFGFGWPRAWAEVLGINEKKDHRDLQWSDAAIINTVFKTDDRHCDSNCRGEPTKRTYPVSLSAPPSADGTAIRLRNPVLECEGAACPFASIVVTPTLSLDEKSYTATVANWGNPVIFKFSATVQKGS